MKASDFDYQLPPQLIAQQPLPERRASRLLVLDPLTRQISDQQFVDFPGYIGPGDLLVFNNTRVFPARLFGHKETGGRVEVLVERLLDDQVLLAHLRSSKSPRPGTRLLLEGQIECSVTGREDEFFVLQQNSAQSWLTLLQQHGHMPLPPYIQRADEDNDRERYQTVYAQKPGAVAAPTAGLHFDDAMLEQLQQQGVNTAYVTLHVGAGTFQPVRVEDVSEHIMHAEAIEVTAEVCQQIRQTKNNGGSGEIRPDRTVHRGYPVVHYPGVRVSRGGCDADQFSSAQIDPDDAGECVCRKGVYSAGLSACGGGGVSVFCYGDAMFIGNRI